jgi:hypothetical protein
VGGADLVAVVSTFGGLPWNQLRYHPPTPEGTADYLTTCFLNWKPKTSEERSADGREIRAALLWAIKRHMDGNTPSNEPTEEEITAEREYYATIRDAFNKAPAIAPLPANWKTMSPFRQRYWLWRNDCGYSRHKAFRAAMGWWP